MIEIDQMYDYKPLYVFLHALSIIKQLFVRVQETSLQIE